MLIGAIRNITGEFEVYSADSGQLGAEYGTGVFATKSGRSGTTRRGSATRAGMGKVTFNLSNIEYPIDSEIRPSNIALLPLISY